MESGALCPPREVIGLREKGFLPPWPPLLCGKTWGQGTRGVLHEWVRDNQRLSLLALTAAAARTGDRTDRALHDPGNLVLLKGIPDMGVLDTQSGWIPDSQF